MGWVGEAVDSKMGLVISETHTWSTRNNKLQLLRHPVLVVEISLLSKYKSKKYCNLSHSVSESIYIYFYISGLVFVVFKRFLDFVAHFRNYLHGPFIAPTQPNKVLQRKKYK